MGVALPSFILGYHGCDRTLADKVFAGSQSLELSHNDYDWLGDGIYFWEHNAQRAFDFAKDVARKPHPSGQKIKNPAVVGAIIDLGYCLNLLDSRYISMVSQAHQDLKSTLQISGLAMPSNHGGIDLRQRKLDCAVIRFLHQQRHLNKDFPFQTVRAAFLEGGPLYENAGFAAKNHIQVAVRDIGCIRGYFRPLNEKGQPVRFS